MSELSWTWEGVEIRVDRWGMFVFDLDGQEVSQSSLREAKEKINDLVKQKRKAATKEKLNLPVITDSGERCAITGIHAGTGRVLLSDKSIDVVYGLKSLYAYTEEVERLMQERVRLSKNLGVIEDQLKGFWIEKARKSYADRNSFDVAAAMDKLSEEHAEKVKLSGVECHADGYKDSPEDANTQ